MKEKVLEQWASNVYQMALVERDSKAVEDFGMPRYTVRTNYQNNWLCSCNHLTLREAKQYLKEQVQRYHLTLVTEHQATIEALQEEVKGLRGALEEVLNQVKLLQDRNDYLQRLQSLQQGGTQ
jgi:TolA-binding protein